MSDSKFSDYDFSQIPFDDIKSFGQRSLLHRNLFNVSWLLGRFCNYKCSYCWPYARSDVRDHRPTDLLVRTMDEIKKQARANDFNSFHFSFSGGEPTLHPGFLTLLSHLSNDSMNSDYQSTHMTSNLSPGIGWFKKYIETTENLSRVSITASWHREFANKEDFRDKIHLMQENDIHVTVNMVMVPSLFEEFYKEALFFHENNINVTLKPQSNTSATKIVDGYTEEQLKLLHNGMPQRNYTEHRMVQKNIQSKRIQTKKLDHGIDISNTNKDTAPQSMQIELTDRSGKKWYLDQAERFNAFEFNKFKDWYCHAGFQGIVIREPDGAIKRSYSCHDEPLGNIETGFQIFNRPMKCNTPSCVSSVDNKMPKFRD